MFKTQITLTNITSTIVSYELKYYQDEDGHTILFNPQQCILVIIYIF